MEADRDKSLVLITGGARSGKSTFAENLAVNSGKPVIYLATARVEDEEMRERVNVHQKRRPHFFRTVEEPLEPHRILEKEAGSGSLVLLDCLTLLVSNIILLELDQRGAVRQGEEISTDESMLEAAGKVCLDRVCKLSEAAHAYPDDVLIVTNEVGMGLVPDYPLGRIFRDYSGRANQVMAQAADEVWFAVCGIARRFK
ncbi:MAG: bifunctional adenosylcobinamide kinase/adenosylcobinamide-phosphate guanylyltransferase [Bacillota bacterium]